MQDCPLSILQAANLFVYTMNNPVKWTDPWGLFAWNEANDQWITVSRWTTLEAGGTFNQTWITGPDGIKYITISIWGVTVNFYQGTDGVSTSSTAPILNKM
jgi:hypothetical protein